MTLDVPHKTAFRGWVLTPGRHGRNVLMYLLPTRHAERPRVGLFFLRPWRATDTEAGL